jgi:hypothetical protein
MKIKHTQGPWVEHDDLTVRDSKRVEIAKINAFVDIVNYKEPSVMAQEILANSRLIAAAPDLLKALEDLIQSSVTSASVPKMNQAKRAIAKAKGEEE